MQTILTVVHVLLSIGLIGLVLIQHGKGADAGAAFGGGASATVFGARGAGNFLSRTTAMLAALFFATSIALAYYATKAGESRSLMDSEGAGGEIPALSDVVEPSDTPGADGGSVASGAPAEGPEIETGPPPVPVPGDGSGEATDVPAVSDVPVPTGD